MVMSGSQRSKEDDVQKIFTSVFVTNFPDGTKVGKIFDFVRFIKVLDIDPLINNLCTVWVRRNKIHANVARFQREPLHKQSNKNVGMEECPNMVLDETCLNHEDFSLCLLEKVKEFASLTNLKVVLGKERYVNIELKYIGDERVICVEVEGVPCKWWSRNTFSRIASRWGTLLNREELKEEGYHSNKICIRTKLKTVVFDSFNMVYRGMTCWVRPGWVPDFEEDGEEGYDVNDGSHENDMYGGVSENLQDVKGESGREEVPKTNFEEVPNKSIFEGNSVRQNDVHSDDPFGIYEVLNKKRDAKILMTSMKIVLNIHMGSHLMKREMGRKMEYAWDNMFMIGLRFKLKKMLWDYLSFVIGNWNGEVVIMGDFNKVRDISEWFVSIFNKHGAEAFNSFIVNASLVEVPLGGCSFTWCHKSAKKMIKLDRFLIFNNLMCSCPSISSTSLDRFLSDHRPIIMREAHYDYGPIPFKFFHYWFELYGFDKLVEQTWLEANVNDQNSYTKFMNKLKYLKENIQIWARLHKERLNN
nr:RNA-directed DNA polymerase, eukaryota [Tanacetum cinerariifolium]